MIYFDIVKTKRPANQMIYRLFNYFYFVICRGEKMIPSSPICLFINDLQRCQKYGSPFSSHLKNTSIFRSDCYQINVTKINQNSIPSKLLYFYFHRSR